MLEKYNICKTFNIFPYKESIILNQGTKQKIISKEKWNKNKKIFEIMIDSNAFTKKELGNWFTKFNIGKDIKDYIKTESILINSEFDTNHPMSRTSLMLNYIVGNGDFKTLENKIIDTNFLIIGCGGIGNAISYALASLGAKNLMMIDKDIIEKTNLNRQFIFEKKDILKSKTQVLKNGLENRFDNLNIDSYDLDISQSEDLNKISKIFENLDNKKTIAILSADEFEIFKTSNNLATKYEIPIINVGYFNDIAVVGPFYIPILNSSCLLCNGTKLKLSSKMK